MSSNQEEFNTSYIGVRNDIISLVPTNAARILDIGCSIGINGKEIKKKNENAEVIGIEIDREMANEAEKNIDKVILGNIEQIKLTDYFSIDFFDCIIFADVLEHLKEPWLVLKNAVKHLKPDGVVIISIPNIRHYTTIFNLIFRGYWPYRERGIHDKTHLRFFTLKNIHELLDTARLEIIHMKRNYRIFEKPHPKNKYARFLALPLIREFFVFQYIVVAKIQSGSEIK